MRTTLTKHGEQTVLVLEQEFLDRLHIDVETPLDVETDGETLVIAPVRDPERRQKFNAALERTNQKYGRMLQRLIE